MSTQDRVSLLLILTGVGALWAFTVIAEFIRFVRLCRKVARLPAMPVSVFDAFRLVARGELTAEQATLWLEWNKARKGVRHD